MFFFCQTDEESNKEPFIVHYSAITGIANTTASSVWRLEPNHTHFHFFDDGKDKNNQMKSMKNMLLKRQEIECKLIINKAIKSPVVGYQSESISSSMCSSY